MNELISRRDFLNGALLASAGLFLHGKAPTISPADGFNALGRIGDYRHSNGNTWDVLSAGHAMRGGAFAKGYLECHGHWRELRPRRRGRGNQRTRTQSSSRNTKA